jgi:thiol-disulfide isomerase/thioredoxin
MKVARSVRKFLKPKNLNNLLVTIVVIGLLYFLIKYLMKSREGFEGHTTLLLNHMKGCGHCEELMPEWDKFESQNDTIIKTKKVEVNDDPSVAKKYGVKGFPTILLIGPTGEKLDTYEGTRDSNGLLSYVKSKL